MAGNKMEEVWQVAWSDNVIHSYPHIEELKEDLFEKKILFSSREKAEGYVEIYFKRIAEDRLKSMIDFDDELGAGSEWNDRKAKKVQWDNVSQDFIDLHERWGGDMRATSYWIEPEHAFDHYGLGIAYVSCKNVR